ncbi:MAG: PAS domain S-box protein [Pseudolabrys sp.]|nr:PAS domain S-box protein [Pseudolabrys sp.]
MLDNVAALGLGPVFDTVDIGLVVLDSDIRVVAWNDWMARVTGRPSKDVIGKTLHEVFPDLQSPRLITAIDDSFAAGSSSVLTHTLNKLFSLSDGHGELLLHNIVVRPVVSNAQVFCLLQVSDVTVAVTRERILRERQNARYHAIVDSAPDAIITINPDRTIQWANGAAEDVFGYGLSELLGQKIDLLLDKDSALLSYLADDAVFPETDRAIGVTGKYKDGESGSFEVSLGHWTADQRDFVTTIWRDVSERVASDRALREARDALEKINQDLETRVEERTRENEVAMRQLHESQKMESIGQLTGGIAHDFNNLLAIILGSLGLLKKAVPDDARVARLLDRAIQGAERGATLTTRLLAFARRQELKVTVVSLQRLMPEMLDFVRHSVGPNISINVDVAPEVASVEVDANQLELALINLAVNARDAMPDGGSLTIACHNETNGKAHGMLRDDYVCVTVTDTGEGMSEATLARAQEPFYTTKGIGKGTGLGLSMVHGFTAQSGGMMRIKSAPGKGTTVTLWLPRASERDAAEVKVVEAPPTVTSSGLRVLLVDDDILVSMGAADMLLDLGHIVTEAKSGMEALQILDADSSFDVVITDYAMPQMNGLDLAHKVQERLPKMPIIMATGYAELPSGKAFEFERLSKPYSQHDLSAALVVAMKGK